MAQSSFSCSYHALVVAADDFLKDVMQNYVWPRLSLRQLSMVWLTTSSVSATGVTNLWLTNFFCCALIQQIKSHTVTFPPSHCVKEELSRGEATIETVLDKPLSSRSLG